MPQQELRYRIDDYTIEIYAVDRKGLRTRWGDRIIHLFSEGKEVACAVFGPGGKSIPEPYVSQGKIFYFASADQFSEVLDLLRREKSVSIVWRPVRDPKEAPDGDAVFTTGD